MEQLHDNDLSLEQPRSLPIWICMLFCHIPLISFVPSSFCQECSGCNQISRLGSLIPEWWAVFASCTELLQQWKTRHWYWVTYWSARCAIHYYIKVSASSDMCRGWFPGQTPKWIRACYTSLKRHTNMPKINGNLQNPPKCFCLYTWSRYTSINHHTIAWIEFEWLHRTWNYVCEVWLNFRFWNCISMELVGRLRWWG